LSDICLLTVAIWSQIFPPASWPSHHVKGRIAFNWPGCEMRVLVPQQGPTFDSLRYSFFLFGPPASARSELAVNRDVEHYPYSRSSDVCDSLLFCCDMGLLPVGVFSSRNLFQLPSFEHTLLAEISEPVPTRALPRDSIIGTR
jgi:hypothetical protein